MQQHHFGNPQSFAQFSMFLYALSLAFLFSQVVLLFYFAELSFLQKRTQ